MRDNRDIAEDWMSNSDYIVILNIENEDKLTHLIGQASAANIRTSIFREPDINNQITAIALSPGSQSKKLCSNLPLALKG